MKGKMKAVLISKPNDLKVQEVDIPTIGRDEVLIRSKGSGICHSDYDLIGGTYYIPIGYPAIPGHEWAGEVVEVGKEVEAFKVGDRVIGECAIGCGVCSLCKSGNFTNCLKPDHFGFSIHGGHAEYLKAKPEWMHKLPDALSFDVGLSLEPFSVGYFAVEVNGGTDASETVAILGGGTIGLCALAAVKGKGGRAIVVEPMAKRMEIAKLMGADFVIDPSKEDPVTRTLDLTEGQGADLAILATGVDQALTTILDLVRNNGRISMVGINVGKKHSIEFGRIQAKGLVVKGCVGSPWVWQKALRFLEYGKIDITRIQTHRFHLEEAVAAFELASQADKCVKVLLVNE
jgi:L-iditol 2-dehydrogenase